MESLFQDLRYGARLLGRHRGATLVAVLTLALGIGVNTAVFSVVHAVLLRPLPVRDVDRLATIAMANPRLNASGAQPGFAAYARWREYGTLFASVAASSGGTAEMQYGGASEAVKTWRVTANFLPTLGVAPALGRNFTAQEDQPGGGGVALLGNEFWRARFAADPRVIGAALQLDRAAHTVVGVLPPGFHVDGRPAQVYVPMARSLRATEWAPVDVYARLQPGVTVEQAGAQMEALSKTLDKGGIGWRPRVWKLRDFQVREVRLSLWLLLGAVGLVLLIACANTASLLLAKAQARRRELAIRASLGAGRLRLLRQLLTESTLLALAGGACGVGLAGLLVRLAPRLMNDRLPGLLEQTRVDGVVLAFTLVISIATGLLFGAVPGLSLARETARAEARTVGGSARWCRALIVTETALALVLAVGAMLLIRSFFYLRDVAPGFRVDSLVAATVNSEKARFSAPDQVVAYYREIAGRVRSIPGVRAATFASALPLSGDNWVMSWPVEGHAYATPRDYPVLYQRTVDTEYFRTLQIPLRRGRFFGVQDHRTAPKVVVVNEAFARRFWPGQEAVGRHVGGGPVPLFEVIGVAGDVRHQDATQEAPVEVLFHHAQMPTLRVTLAIRVNEGVYRNPLQVEPAIREAVAALDRKQAVTRVVEVQQVISDRVAPKRLSAQLIGVFAGLALLLAAVGVYGVLSFGVAQRTAEIGLRMALGATPGKLLAMIAAQAAGPALAGIAAGICTSLCLTHLLSSLLFGVRPDDPWMYAAAGALLLAVALGAALGPAVRATRVDPLPALRGD
jgi:putative ABC transport system permease protein